MISNDVINFDYYLAQVPMILDTLGYDAHFQFSL